MWLGRPSAVCTSTGTKSYHQRDTCTPHPYWSTSLNSQHRLNGKSADGWVDKENVLCRQGRSYARKCISLFWNWNPERGGDGVQTVAMPVLERIRRIKSLRLAWDTQWDLSPKRKENRRRQTGARTHREGLWFAAAWVELEVAEEHTYRWLHLICQHVAFAWLLSLLRQVFLYLLFYVSRRDCITEQRGYFQEWSCCSAMRWGHPVPQNTIVISFFFFFLIMSCELFPLLQDEVHRNQFFVIYCPY